MTRLPRVFLGIVLVASFALPQVALAAAGPDGGVLVAQKAKKKKKPKKRPKAQKKPAESADTPALEKGMKVVALADAQVRSDPAEDAERVFRAREGQVLTVVRVEKRWVRVKDAEGQVGWLEAAEIVPKAVYDAQAEGGGGGGDDDGDDGGDGGGGDDEGGADDGDGERADRGREDETEDDGDGDGDDDDDSGVSAPVTGRGATDGKIRIAAGARLVGLMRTQEFASNGSNAYANYTIDVSSPGADLFARVTRKGGKLELGAEASFLLTFGNGGVTVNEGAAAETLEWSEQKLDIRALVGYHVTSGVLLSARLGYSAYTIDITDSPTILHPSEALSGVGLGAEAVFYTLYPKMELRVGAETLVAASLEQTEGRKDGDTATVSPFYLFVEGGYLLSPKLQLVGGYHLSVEAYSFTGTSQRDPLNGNGARNDLQHTFSVGAQYWF